MTTELEIKFIESIDCRFPYHNRPECLRLIDEAISISTNAMFSVTEEICRVPHSEKDKVTVAFLLELLTIVKSKFNHPLKEMVLDTADKMVLGQELTVDEAISKMRVVKGYPGQFAALNVLYFSCDDTEGKLEPVRDKIMVEWKNNATQHGV